MFRNFYPVGRVSDGHSDPSSAPFGVASVGFDSQESSWIGLLSRPALSLLRKVRRWSAAPAELGSSFLGEERDILIIPHHLGFTQGPPDASGPWLSAVSVRHGGTEIQPQVRFFSSVRALLGPQEAAGGKAWAGNSGPWWGSFLRRGDIQEGGGESRTIRPPQPESSGPPQQLHNVDTVQNTAARPEQDQGYHSLEGEPRPPPTEGQPPQMEPVPEEPEPEEVLSAPQCGNKSIAFIMGLPCSDDDSSQNESESGSDDDGFDSEGSSDLTSDEDDETSDSDEEPDPDWARLWSSFSRSADRYNPQSFRAELHTGRAPQVDPRRPPADPRAPQADLRAPQADLRAPQADPRAPQADPRAPQADPRAPQVEPRRPQADLRAPQADLRAPQADPRAPQADPRAPQADPRAPQADPAPPLTAPPSSQDSWDDSASASEADEAESLLLLRSFSCSSDPYCPLNFQAPLRTRGPPGPTGPTGPPGAPSRTRSRTGPQNLTPEYRREEAEERLDSGFAEASASNRSTKKVRFCDEVEEFFGEEEDRRGPWEELARDRCRFRRRCQEVERSIGFCLAPAHRRRVYLGLSDS